MIYNIFKANKQIEDLTYQTKVLEDKLAATTPESKTEMVSKLEEENKELKASILEYQTSVEELVTVKADKQTLEAKIVELHKHAEDTRVTNDNIVKDTNSTMESLKKQISDLQSQLEAKTTSVNRQVAMTVASLGINEGIIPVESNNAQSDKEIYDTFSSLKENNLKQQKYFAEHKDVIMAYVASVRKQ